MKNSIGFLLSLLIFLSIGCNDSNENSNSDGTATGIPISTPSIISKLPHDTSYYTEGLEFYDSTLLESTGNYGPSKIIQRDLTGKVLKEISIDKKYFGEGITVLNDTLYHLTYREKTAFAYDVKTFKKIKEFPFEVGEGWGLTNDGKNIIASTGSSNLYYFEPGTFKLLKTVAVTENGDPVVNINELEYVDGFIYANQYTLNYIVKIDASSGKVVAKYNLDGLVASVKGADQNVDVLNGIAYNPANKKFYITGKHWPQMFEIQF